MTAPSDRSAPSALALVFASAPLSNVAYVLVALVRPDGVAVDQLRGATVGFLWMLLVPAIPALRRFAAELGAWLSRG